MRTTYLHDINRLKDDQFYYINNGIETTETVSHPLLKLFLDGDSPLVVVLLKVDTYSEIGNFPHSDLIAAFTSAVRKTFNKVHYSLIYHALIINCYEG